ncbi:YbgC/FadM family acyl-CoA thioesterase [Melaminivora alkalimesophila]|uniref:YbgC/YbaW family acyl-CoA thioester hydrolase n=1 Tax=Melaminivora alkalimesophila TaxID=1165852 RepID=A0A317R7V6_9BURK|nr:YbgC/FadM family acyl-CoA thioesterase [Melaminivora alkalimesophila]PWW43618.1 YbgC/YbaW family acyl-CoA thioester hydrolase [Melaminivora alkalimesophila]
MQRQDFRCLLRLRVRWSEVDPQGIVFNAHYLSYADCAIAEYWRRLGLPYAASMQKLQGDVYLKKASTLYHASARLDDWLDVGMRCARLGTSSMAFECGIFNGERLLTTIELVYVFADPASQTKRELPSVLRTLIEDYEAGREVVEVATGDWSAMQADAMAVRMAVFVQEQGIDPAIEIDAHDADALHAVVRNRLGLPIATGRLLLPDAAGEARIGRMAVERTVRGQRWGRMVLDALLQAARERGDASVLLHAQRSAEGFYRRAGFAPQGEPFEEAGISHIAMRLPLR